MQFAANATLFLSNLQLETTVCDLFICDGQRAGRFRTAHHSWELAVCENGREMDKERVIRNAVLGKERRGLDTCTDFLMQVYDAHRDDEPKADARRRTDRALCVCFSERFVRSRGCEGQAPPPGRRLLFRHWGNPHDKATRRLAGRLENLLLVAGYNLTAGSLRLFQSLPDAELSIALTHHRPAGYR